jgi:hypothetical protein
MAEVRPARNGRLCKSMFRGKLRALARMSARGAQEAHQELIKTLVSSALYRERALY